MYARLKRLIANVEITLRELRDPAVVAFLHFDGLEPTPILEACMRKHLERWCPRIPRITLLGAIPPAGGLELSMKLFKLVESIELIRRELEQPTMLDFLDIGDAEPLPTTSFVSALNEVTRRAHHALSSSSLVNKKGKAKSGAGRAMPPLGSLPRAFCAAG